MKHFVDTTLPGPISLEKKRGYHHGNLRNSIMNAVAQLIGEKKTLDFRLKEVAEMVGTTQQAVYKHFENKAALLVETAVEGYQLQNRYREHALSKAGSGPLSKILAIADAYIYFSRANPGYFLLMKNLETKEMLSSTRYMVQRNQSVETLVKLIQQCMDEGLFIDIERHVIHTVLQSAAYGLAHLYITGQISLIASDHLDDPQFPLTAFEHSIRSFLTEKGMKEISLLPKTPFVGG